MKTICSTVEVIKMNALMVVLKCVFSLPLCYTVYTMGARAKWHQRPASIPELKVLAIPLLIEQFIDFNIYSYRS